MPLEKQDKDVASTEVSKKKRGRPRKVTTEVKEVVESVEPVEPEQEAGTYFDDPRVLENSPVKKEKSKKVKEDIDLLNTDPNTIEDVALRRRAVIAQQTRLVRISIANLDPNDSELEGEIVTVHLKYAGTVRKYVPYSGTEENGYHVPYCILNYLKDKTFTVRTPKKNNNRFGVKGYEKL